MAAIPKPRVTAEEYLALDRNAPTKSEYVDGQIVAMSGASLRHNLIVGNLIGEFHRQLRRSPCQVYPSDVRVLIPRTGDFFYPDVTVLCEPPQLADANMDILKNPTLVVEVLSDSTEGFDRGKKFRIYRTMESLREYVLVDQRQMLVELYTRQADGTWVLTTFSQPEDVVRLASVGCELLMAEIYAKVVFEDEGEV